MSDLLIWTYVWCIKKAFIECLKDEKFLKTIVVVCLCHYDKKSTYFNTFRSFWNCIYMSLIWSQNSCEKVLKCITHYADNLPAPTEGFFGKGFIFINIFFCNQKMQIKTNPAYRRHWISQCVRIVALIPKRRETGEKREYKYHMSHSKRHVSHVVWRVSHVVWRVSHVTNANSDSHKPSPC